jgi:class 3 adenylate cyclase
MFCDIVGLTALSAGMDPEDVREIIAVVQRSVDWDVNRYGGFVAKYMGDGVLVYFGYPHAHEDDAERAARAALDIIPGDGTDQDAHRGQAQGTYRYRHWIGGGRRSDRRGRGRSFGAKGICG